MTRKEIRDLGRKRLGETTAAFWNDSELNTWINDSGSDLAFRTGCIKTNATITSVLDQQEYTASTVDAKMLAIYEAYYKKGGSSGTWQEIDSTSRAELNIENPGWMSFSSGTPDKYFHSRDEDLIVLIAAPDSANAGAFFKVYYTKKYTDVTGDSDVPGVAEELHMAMSDYMVAIGFETRGYGDKSNNAWAQYYQRIADYLSIKRIEEESDEEIVMRNYR